MNLGVNIFSLRKELKKNQNVYSCVKKAGFDNVELMIYKPDDDVFAGFSNEKINYAKENLLYFFTTFHQALETLQGLKEQGLSVNCVHVGLTEKDKANPEEYAKSLCELSEQTGIKDFVIGSPEFIKDADKTLNLLNGISTFLYQKGKGLLSEQGWANKSGFEKSYIPDKILSGTGAGDTSIAAFLTAMTQGYSIEECMSLAAGTGASCVSAYDALRGLLTFDQLNDKIKSGWNKMQ